MLARAMETSWEAARAEYDAGRICAAELSCVYVIDRVRRRAGARWLQGPRRPPLDAGPDAPAVVKLFAERELLGLPRAAPEALVAWAAGKRRVDLTFSMPSPRELLAMQARGRRCVSLLPDESAPPGPKAAYGGGGLGFVVHDLCHLEKFADPEHHAEQVGLFASLDRALSDPRWAAVESGFDARYLDARDHVLADMNGSAVFLFMVLRNKVKLAVRQQIANRRGVPCPRGDLDPEEARAYADALDVLLSALDLSAEARDAARLLSSRHDATIEAAGALSRVFAARGEVVLKEAAGPLDPVDA